MWEGQGSRICKEGLIRHGDRRGTLKIRPQSFSPKAKAAHTRTRGPIPGKACPVWAINCTERVQMAPLESDSEGPAMGPHSTPRAHKLPSGPFLSPPASPDASEPRRPRQSKDRNGQWSWTGSLDVSSPWATESLGLFGREQQAPACRAQLPRTLTGLAHPPLPASPCRAELPWQGHVGEVCGETSAVKSCG